MSDTAIIPENTTLIDVYLKNPNGHPLTNTRFIVKPVRAGFWNDYVGVVEDKEELYCTDENGYVQLHLWPLPYPYMLTYSYDDNAVPGYFMFYVPDIRTVVQFQDLIVTQARDEPTYGETILAQIVAAKAQVSALVDEAKASESAAAASATSAGNSATVSTQQAQLSSANRQAVADVQTGLENILNQLTLTIAKIQAIDLQNILIMDGSFIWVDSVNRLRIGTVKPTDKDTEGVIVGTQS